MEVLTFVTSGLGDSSFLLVEGDEAVLIDPQRDVGRMLDAAADRRARLRFVAETHVHNDYISGALEARAVTGAQIAGPRDAGYRFEFIPLGDGDRIELGGARLVALHTPGHTPEHVSYALFDASEDVPTALFTGGSLIVGSAGRTDLLGPERAEELTRAQYVSLRRLGAFPDAARVFPTHGAGSFCASAPPGEERWSTLGRERASNPALAAVDEETFVRARLSGLVAYPSYYVQMAPINRAGPPVVGDPPVPAPLSVQTAAASIARGAVLVDARGGADFAAAHVPGALNVPLEESFATYVAWMLPFDHPIVLAVPRPEDDALREAAVQLFRIGYSAIEGYLPGGAVAWGDAGHEIASYPALDARALAGEIRLAPDTARRLLDVRQRTEWDEGHIEGSAHVFVGDLHGIAGGVPTERPVTTICASGFRAAIAASALARDGVPVRVVATGGVDSVRPRLR